LASAAMMLYGIYRVSIDPGMLHEEASQLAFNFSSLQLYEVMLVVTAIVLARRAVWYDSTLLVALENMFVFVPFILLSQAALLGHRWPWAMCFAASALVCGRLWGMKHYIRELNVPSQLLLFGLPLLAVNLVFPLYFKSAIEQDNEAWARIRPWFWFFILPMLLAVANVLPRAQTRGQILPQRPWLPLGIYILWMAATCVHIHSIDYVDNQRTKFYLFAPVLWMLTWTLWHRLDDFAPHAGRAVRTALLALPALATFVAVSAYGAYIFFTLTLLNVAGYAALFLVDRKNRFIEHLLLASLAALVAGMPESWGRVVVPDFLRQKTIVLSFAGYVLFWVTRSSKAQMGFCGAILAGLGTEYFFAPLDYLEQFAMQSALMYLLVHSVRWTDDAEHGSRALRVAAAIAWTVHSFVWVRIATVDVYRNIALAGLLMLAIYYLVEILRGTVGPRIIAISSLLVFLCVPINFAVEVLRITPTGYLTVLGSFLVFAIGTAVALTKHRWNPPMEVGVDARDGGVRPAPQGGGAT